MIKKITLKNVVHILVKVAPEFKKYKDFTVWNINDQVEYTGLLDIFGHFFTERVENYSENDRVIQRVYNFLNGQLNKSDSDKEALDYLAGEIFENLSGSKKGAEISRKFLTGKALERFNECEKYYGVS